MYVISIYPVFNSINNHIKNKEKKKNIYIYIYNILINNFYKKMMLRTYITLHQQYLLSVEK